MSSVNDPCQQENLLDQLDPVRSLHAPLDNLTANEASMLMRSLACKLKALRVLRSFRSGLTVQSAGQATEDTA